MQLREYQKKGVEWLLSGRVRGLAFDAGLGKTITAIEAARRVGRPVVVVCPAAVECWWREQIGLPLRRSRGDENDAWYVTSYDRFVTHTPDCRGKVLIFDEAHYLKNPKTRRAKKALAANSVASHMWFLTATPATNSPFDYYVPLSLIAKLPPPEKWIREYCDVYYDVIYDRVRVLRFLPGARDRLRQQLERLWMFVRWEHVLDEVPPITFAPVPIVSEQASARLKAIMQEVPELREDVEFLVANQTNLTRVRHLWGIVKASEVAYFIRDRIVGEWAGERLVVSCEFHDCLNLIHSQITSEAPLVVQYTGDMTPHKRDAAVHSWKATPGAVLMLQIRAGGTGLNLPEGRIMVMAEGTWSPADWWQAASRLRRIDRPHPVYVVCPYIADTIDEIVVRTVAKKAAMCEIPMSMEVK